MERIVKLLEECGFGYPPTPHYKVEVLDDSNNKITAYIPKCKAELIVKLREIRTAGKLTHVEMLKLWDLIEEFGFERYCDGTLNEQFNNENEDY